MIYRPWTDDDLRAHISSQLENSSVVASTGETVELPVGEYEVSLCCHSDSPGAVEIVKLARELVDRYNSEQV